MFSMQQVGRKIVNFRKEKNMTQTELADMMNVSYQAVSNWERGCSMPDISKLPQLAELFGCSVDELLDGRSELLHSVMEDELQEYVENNEIPEEELKAAVPVLKPDQVTLIANSLLPKNGGNLRIFYPFLDSDDLEELAERKIVEGGSINDMLPFLDEDSVRKYAMQQYEQGKAVNNYYPFLDSDTLEELAKRKIKEDRPIEDMLPFLDSGFLRRLVLGGEQ